ncbi:MAG: ABC-F family ATP-binding cassette domain-containing protein [Planctomycetes bacterium]|nr:ABC-F family ATP-binding cassette domain-containing protein [Planctomycetota bacterium]
MTLLQLDDVHLAIGDRQLLRGISLIVPEGERIGLVGANGCGKSTLLRILAGELVPDAGERTLRRDLRIGWLPQEPRLDPARTVREEVSSGFAGREAVLSELDAVHEALAAPSLGGVALERLLAQQHRLEARVLELGGHDVGHRVEAMLLALGLPRPEARCGELSGGERRRAALAQLLLSSPELLLLDEPTNHLDAQVIAWLEDTLRDAGTPFVLVTHDRYFLDRLVDRIVEIDDGIAHSYDGAYFDYVQQRAERLEREAKSERTRLNLLRRETEWMRRGPPARTTKAKARIKIHDALVDAAPAMAAEDLAFKIPDGPRLGDRVVRLRGVHKAFEGRDVLRGLDLEIGSGERVGVVGPNGAGKTTLLNLVASSLLPDRGEVILGSTVKVARIDQGRTDLDPQKTVLQEVGRGNDWVVVGGRGVRIEGFLEQFLFPGGSKHSLVGTLSGGERNRVLLAKLLMQGGNVILLDEPTNDLDLMSLQALEEALIAFAGAVIVVSHDRWFLDRVATRIVHLDGRGTARVHEGDLSALLERLAAEERAAAAASNAAASTAAAQRGRRRDPDGAAPKVRKLSSREQRELDELPPRIEAVEAELATVDARLSDPTLYTATNRAEFDRLTSRRAALPGEIEALYARWEELETVVDEARRARG